MKSERNGTAAGYICIHVYVQMHALEITSDLPFGFPINNIISLHVHLRAKFIGVALCTFSLLSFPLIVQEGRLQRFGCKEHVSPYLQRHWRVKVGFQVNYKFKFWELGRTRPLISLLRIGLQPWYANKIDLAYMVLKGMYIHMSMYTGSQSSNTYCCPAFPSGRITVWPSKFSQALRSVKKPHGTSIVHNRFTFRGLRFLTIYLCFLYTDHATSSFHENEYHEDLFQSNGFKFDLAFSIIVHSKPRSVTTLIELLLLLHTK